MERRITSYRLAAVRRHRSRQLIQQRLRVLQVRRIETFGEPIVDRTEQITGLRALALVAPEPGEAGRCSQLEELCALPLGNGDGLTIVLLGRRIDRRRRSADRLAPDAATQLRRPVPRSASIDPCSLGETVPLLQQAARAGRRPRQASVNRTGVLTTPPVGRNFASPWVSERKSFLCLPERDQRPSAECQCPARIKRKTVLSR